MDDYLTKPLDISRLQDVLDRFMGARTAPAPMSDASARVDNAIRARLHDIAGGDTEFAGELINAFIMGGEEALREMNSAVQSKDRGALGRAAHKLKGASANLHIDALANMANELEVNAKAGKEGDASQPVAQLAAEFQRVAEALRGELSGELKRAV
jgi:HPt (histidine-containing phosphotransfer) domain-containing protein